MADTEKQYTDEDLARILGSNRMGKWFRFAHLKPEQQKISRMFAVLAATIIEEIPALTPETGAEKTVALRKLLESKDAAVRATFDD